MFFPHACDTHRRALQSEYMWLQIPKWLTLIHVITIIMILIVIHVEIHMVIFTSNEKLLDGLY